jgi:hypothetical protein
MATERSSARPVVPRLDELDGDVPAAVLCAFCGRGDCTGCGGADEQASGIVAIVPWERPGAGMWSRLFATAKLTTVGAESFFSALPDGEASPALRFAVVAELLAVGSMMSVLVALAALALPTLALAVVESPALRATALRWFAVGVPALALWMVAAHATHGAALDSGARRQGARPQRRRAVRFGLYACGWDLMAGPLGALYALFTGGRAGLAELAKSSARVPGRSSTALLTGVYALGAAATERARRAGTIAAVALSLVSGAVVVAIVIALMI